MIDFIKREDKAVRSLIIVKNGKLVTDVSFNGHNSESIHETQSCSKSINSALVGISINDGLIKNVNQIYDIQVIGLTQFKYPEVNSIIKSIMYPDYNTS